MDVGGCLNAHVMTKGCNTSSVFCNREFDVAVKFVNAVFGVKRARIWDVLSS